MQSCRRSILALSAHCPRSLRKQSKLRPLHSGRRENPIDKNSLRILRVESVFGLLSPRDPQSLSLRTGVAASGAPRAHRPRLRFFAARAFSPPLPAFYLVELGPASATTPGSGRGGVRGGPRGPAPRSCWSRQPPWPPDRPGRAAEGPRNRDSGKQGAWWGSWPWRRQLLPLR